jgi:glycosyltransferase involved in cell wall biosynthesis
MNFFDITRLSKRSETTAPSGIDRVDLAYLKWLRESGLVEYLVNGISGFTHIHRSQGDAFLTAIESKWYGKHAQTDLHELPKLEDTSHRYRMASKWWARRKKLNEILSENSLANLSQAHDADLDLLDVSAEPWAYRVDPAWRQSDKSGCFFGISHSMLSRTAYMAALANHRNLKRVFFIHDTIPCDFPEFCRDDEGARHLLRIRNAFRYGTHLVVNSDYTKQRLDDWRKRLGEKVLPIEVIPIGVDQGLLDYTHNDAARTDSKRPYFVILGTIEPRKNHALILDIWQSFVNALTKEAVPELLIIGKRGWENEAVFKTLDHCESLRGHVREMNHVSDDELWPLLKGARAMLFPSFVEGWGMPLVEALTLGVPVIASDIPAFHEAGQGAPELISLSDSHDWAALITDYAGLESTRRSDQQQRLEKFRPPTWSEHFAKVQTMIGDEPHK